MAQDFHLDGLASWDHGDHFVEVCGTTPPSTLAGQFFGSCHAVVLAKSENLHCLSHWLCMLCEMICCNGMQRQCSSLIGTMVGQ